MIIASQFLNGEIITKWSVERWKNVRGGDHCGGNRSHLCALLQNSRYFDFTSQKTCSTSYKYNTSNTIHKWGKIVPSRAAGREKLRILLHIC